MCVIVICFTHNKTLDETHTHAPSVVTRYTLARQVIRLIDNPQELRVPEAEFLCTKLRLYRGRWQLTKPPRVHIIMYSFFGVIYLFMYLYRAFYVFL